VHGVAQFQTFEKMKKIALYCFIACMHSVAGSQPDYSPSQITNLINDGKATQNGAQFSNQGIGCETFLRKDSDDHFVFFFLRDGTSYGEYRDEFLSHGRIQTIREKFLVADLRSSEALKKATEFSFVQRDEEYHWNHDVVVGSKVTWLFITTHPDGTDEQKHDEYVQYLVRGVVSVVFPEQVMPLEKKFQVRLERTTLSNYEKMYGGVEQMMYGGVGTVIDVLHSQNNRYSIWATWPESDPQLAIILDELVPRDPRDSWPFPYRSKEVARMPISLQKPQFVPFAFEAADVSNQSNAIIK